MSIFDRIADFFTGDEDETSIEAATNGVVRKPRVRTEPGGGASVELPGRLVVSRDRYGNWDGHGNYAPQAGESFAQSAETLGLPEQILSFVNPQRKLGQPLRVPLGSPELRAAQEAYEEHAAQQDEEGVIYGPQLAWTNPTGRGMRDDDAGKGYYGAPRGKRKHAGIDYEGDVGGPVFATTDGTAEIVDDGVRITTKRNRDNKQYSARMLHFTPSIANGTQVGEGQTIGVLNDLTRQYNEPRIKPHVHLELYEIENGRTTRRDPSDFIEWE